MKALAIKFRINMKVKEPSYLVILNDNDISQCQSKKSISFARDLNSIKYMSETDNLGDNLIFVLSDRMADHLNYSHSFKSNNEEYSEMLGKLPGKDKIEDEKNS